MRCQRHPLPPPGKGRRAVPVGDLSAPIVVAVTTFDPRRLSGVVAAGMSLAVGEFFAGLFGISSPVVSVGDLVVDVTPGPVVRQTIELFGTLQKPLLLGGIVVVCLLLGGSLGRRSDNVAYAGFLAAGVVGGLSAGWSGSPLGGPAVSVLAAVAGIAVLHKGRSLLPAFLWPEPDRDFIDVSRDVEDPRIRVATRRGFLGYVAGMTVAAGSLAVGSRVLVDRRGDRLREEVTLPTGRRTIPAGDRTVPAPTTTEGPFGPPEGLTSWITPNDRFYRIDTALVVPRVDSENWSLSVDGLVDRQVTVTLEDLLAMDLVDAAVTLNCVSNEVGGHLVGNAVWTGVPLLDLLESAGISTDAEQVMGRSVDGFTAGFPLHLLDGDRTALIAVGMNGEPLPFRHGFPARLVVAGIYGYVSAVKWLHRISLTTMDEDGYWIPRGWAKEAPIKIASRIDVPLRSQLPAGRHAVAGVAWAPVSGVAAVELRVDDGPWTECRLWSEEAPGRAGDSWVQWSTEWDAQPGIRWLRVRAHDRDGRLQPAGPKAIAPDGAEGWHARQVLVV